MTSIPAAAMPEHHLLSRVGWLRAAVMGANDGICSTAALIVGVAAANADRPAILLAGMAGLAAGAMSMAAGEYVSVSSQADTERADLAREAEELERHPEDELRELAEIYQARGLDPDLALAVARQLTAKDALGAHARDELGITDFSTARPVQAAFTSAATFAAGAAFPMIVAALAPQPWLIPAVALATLAALALLGAIGARAGGAPMTRGALRVVAWGTLALLLTIAIGRLFGVAMG